MDGSTWRAVGLAVVLALAAACGTDSLLGPDAPQGIDGLVLIGPQCPVQSEENPCPDLPYEAAIELWNEDGEFVTRIRSGTDGTFRVGLRPGSYRLLPQSGDPFPVAQEQTVEVVRDEYVDVTVLFDTGIR